jgi:hypothetical protein
MAVEGAGPNAKRQTALTPGRIAERWTLRAEG